MTYHIFKLFAVLSEEDPEGYWCQWRDDKYPEDLMTIPAYVTPAPVDPGTGGATVMSSSLAGLIILALLSLTIQG